ncbi:sigma-70 family RNA polymerase sigma factor [Psychrobacillus sp. NPDC058041]|uniref:sigma-70 family RNA polymerase sigma factor n=1 Tax=Psychrobacillus sp. NPDC058041 TaxID=3346310 RepID=UPI0036D89B1F
MTIFEESLIQFEPMISACIRKLNIYKNHELYKQAGRIALWQAWIKFDSEKGEFAPYAYRCIYGAILDELKKEKRVEETIHPVEEDTLTVLVEQTLVKNIDNEDLAVALEKLTKNERDLIIWIFVEGISLQQAATRAGITIPGIKKRRERMLIKLRENMLQSM